MQQPKMKQGSKEWKNARKYKISASRVASVLGRGFKTRQALMQEYIDAWQGKPEPEVHPKVQALFDWGNDHEKDARAAYERETGMIVNTSDAFTVHSDFDYLSCSPDGLVFTEEEGLDQYGVEFKCPASWQKNGLPDEPDQKYIDQCQLCMEIYNIDRWDLFYWSPEETRLFTLERDPLWWDWSLPKIILFWEEFLVKRDEADLVVEEMEGFADRYLDLMAERKLLDNEIKQVKAVLVNAADPEHKTVFGNVVAVPSTRKGALDTDKMTTAGIDVEQYRKPDTHFITLKEVK